MIIAIEKLEDAINRCRTAEPFSNGVLPHDMRLMGDVYGIMIYQRLRDYDISGESEETRKVLGKWLVA